MSITTSVQPWLRDAGERERSITIARTHVAAETSTDTEAICATVAADAFFALPARRRGGNDLPPGSVLTRPEQIRAYYAGRADSYVVVASAQLASVGTSWYCCNESAATLRGTGEIGGVSVDGRELVVQSAVLFPTAPDGIRGEVCVTRYPFTDIVADTVVTPAPPTDPRTYLPLREMEHCALLDRFVGALRAHDTAAIAGALRANHSMAVRLDDVDRNQRVFTATTCAEAADAFATMFGDVEDLTLMMRIATEWYVFAEYLGRLPDGSVRRLALTHPVEDGVLTGTFGYGRDER